MIHSLEPTLAPTSGPLWVMIQLDDAFRDDDDRALAAEVIAFVEHAHLGVWNGESSGGGAMDISFDVSNQRETAMLVVRFLTQHYPQRSYAIADRYESFFDEEYAPVVGCASALLVNPNQQVLFQLRDAKPTIAYPNAWALPGGHIEAGETAAQAMIRELAEELNYMGAVTQCYEYLFWRTPGVVVHQFLFRGRITVPASAIVFHEGQAMRYLERGELDVHPIAFGYDRICRVIWDEVCAH